MNIEAVFKHMTEQEINLFSKGLVEYLFRSGSVEDMHSAGKLSQDDMCTLNKELTDKASTFFYLLQKGDMKRILKTLIWYGNLGAHWDNPDPQKFMEHFTCTDGRNSKQLSKDLRLPEELTQLLVTRKRKK